MLEVGEAHRGVGEVAEQQQGPPVADQVERDRDGAALPVALTHDGRPTALHQ